MYHILDFQNYSYHHYTATNSNLYSNGSFRTGLGDNSRISQMVYYYISQTLSKTDSLPTNNKKIRCQLKKQETDLLQLT